MTKYPTILSAFLDHADRRSDAPALRYKEDGIWHDISWAEYRRRVLRTAAGLQSLGLTSGDRVGILSTNRIEWLVSDLAALSLGCVTVPIYPSSIPEQVEYILQHSSSRAIFVENQEQLAKVESIRETCPSLSRAVLFSGSVEEEDTFTLDWEALGALGSEAGENTASNIEAAAGQLDPSTIATIVYTSGTTGPPKGAQLSHLNIMAMADSLADVLHLGPIDSSLSFLPLSHIAERLQGEIMAIRTGYTVNMGEGLDKVPENLAEVEPTLLVCVPRLWEKYYSKISSGIQDAPELRQKLFAWATAAGLKAYDRRFEGKSLDPISRIKLDIADRLVLSKVRKKLGMARGRAFVSGAAPLSAEVGRFFASLGITIQEVYGQTECAGVCTYNPVERVKYGSVGLPLGGMEVKIAEDGEILVKGDNVFVGYLNQEQDTAEAIVDGWLHTGDVGEMDSEGYVRITDRKKDIIVTAGGKNVSPQNIENQLKTFPGISQVVVVGDKRKFLSCLFTLDIEGLEDIYRREELELPPSIALPQDKAMRARLQSYVDTVNDKLASYESIKKFEILAEDFSIESGEMTPSLKVKRRVIQKKYEDLIDSFYSEKFA
jgi:long-chain acyl-CoA synthetase